MRRNVLRFDRGRFEQHRQPNTFFFFFKKKIIIIILISHKRKHDALLVRIQRLNSAKSRFRFKHTVTQTNDAMGRSYREHDVGRQPRWRLADALRAGDDDQLDLFVTVVVVVIGCQTRL
jgi:hypothetical protein